jgi:Right handed beta helix region
MDRRQKRRTVWAVMVSALALGLGSALAATTHCVQATGGSCSASCNEAHTTIQAAVNEAAPGDTVHVCAGTYAEQVEITKALTLEGEGAGVTILKPDTVVANASGIASGEVIAAIILVNGATDVSVADLTIDGVDAAFNSCSPGYVGIYYRASSGTIEGTEVINIHHPDAPGCQTVLGIFVQGGLPLFGLHADVEVRNNDVNNYGKNGITANGPGATVVVENNTITGRGPVEAGDAAQNGVQLGVGAHGSVAGNTISNHFYTPADTLACGVLLFLASRDVGPSTDNIFTGNEQNVCILGIGPVQGQRSQ